MHLELLTHGINVPNSNILPPARDRDDHGVAQEDLERIGIPFVIKPANTTGGGTGVIMDARSLDRIAEPRNHHPNDKYLVQETSHPTLLAGKRAWFRAYHAFGTTILCWWDATTHQYTEVSDGDEAAYGLGGLRHVMEIIRRGPTPDSAGDNFSENDAKKALAVLKEAAPVIASAIPEGFI